MAFDIKDFLSKNKIELGKITRAEGTSTYKGGHNDLRKTSYDVRIKEDGKLDMYTQTSIITESSNNNKAKRSIRIALSDALTALGRVAQIDESKQFNSDAIKLQKQIELFLNKSQL